MPSILSGVAAANAVMAGTQSRRATEFGPGMSTDAFEATRPRLVAIAYRMLGSRRRGGGRGRRRCPALDGRRPDAIANPEAWLVSVTTRRALDVLRSARLQREAYPGVWLPEPIVTGGGPDDDLERAESLTMGFLVLLERLTPIERAVFVLHDVAGLPVRRDRRRRWPLRGRRAVKPFIVPAATSPFRTAAVAAERTEAESVARPLPGDGLRRTRRRAAGHLGARHRRHQ